MSSPDTLLIDLGDLGSLALLALQPDPSRLILWHPRTISPSAGAKLAATQIHASIIGENRLVVAPPISSTQDACSEPAHLTESQLLLRAASVAVQFGCARILWPGHVGSDHTLIADALERMATVASLADPSGSLLIDAPILDLTDAELVELVDDIGAPMCAFSPCEGGDAEPCSCCDGCSRWMTAFKQLGIPWPWSAAPISVSAHVAASAQVTGA